MIKDKNISISVDIERFLKQQQEQNQLIDYSDTEEVTPRSSVFALGNDPRIASQHLSTPEITYIEVLKDGLQNPYTQINWQIKREDIDSGQVVGFDIFRRLKKPEESTSFFAIESFDRDAFSKISFKNKRVGKFSEEKKAISNIKRGLIDLSTLNHNLFLEQQKTNSQASSTDSTGYNKPFANSLDSYSYKKIGNVDYTKFLAEENSKFLVVKDRNIVALYFRDKTVGFGDTYEYYVVAITKQFGKNTSSNSVVVTVEDFVPPHAPTSISVKQTKETEVQVQVTFDTSRNPARAFIYKKSEFTVSYAFVGELQIKSDSFVFIDSDIQYRKKLFI